MGGDDSQKLLPWRGSTPLRGANLRLTAKSTLAQRLCSKQLPVFSATTTWRLALTCDCVLGGLEKVFDQLRCSHAVVRDCDG